MRKTGAKTTRRGVRRVGPGAYRVRGEYVDPKTGRRREFDRIVQAETLAAADRAKDALRAELESLAVKRQRVRVEDFAGSWLRSKLPSLKASTRSLYATLLDTHVVPVFGDYFIDAVTRDDVVAWRDAQEGRPASVNGRLRMLRMLFSDAAEEFGIPDPTRAVSAIRDVRSAENPKVLRPRDVSAVLEAVKMHSARWHPLCVVLATTGARFGEVSALRWADIDLEAGTIHVRRAHYHGTVDTTKTNDERLIPITEDVAEVLRAHLDASQEAAGAVVDQDAWVFPSDVGGLSDPSALRKPLAKAAKALGMARAPSAHWFRHSFNDAIGRVARGTVQRALTGHRTPKMSDHYSTVTLDDRRQAVEAFAGELRSKPGTNPGTEED